MYDLLCVGDTTLDTFLKVHDATVHCDLKSHECELCFRYGEKIPVEQMVQNPGGNSANVAVGTATLGVKTALYAILGDDDIGEKVKRMIAERGVDSKYLFVNKGQKTNYSTIISFKGERTILEIKYPARLTFSKFPETKWVYLSSIKQDPKSIYEPLVRLKKKFGFKIVFNPGIYQLSHKGNDIVKFLKFVNVLIVNKEEAGIIVRKVESRKSKVEAKNKSTLYSLLFTLYSLTHNLVFITDGERGSYEFDGNQMIHCSIFPASRVSDRTGAGDAFSSGVVSALAKGIEYPEAMRWGMANSAAVLREIGPQNGILNSAQMRRILAKVKLHPHKLTE